MCQMPLLPTLVVMPGAGCAFFMACLVKMEETVENSRFVDTKKSYRVFPWTFAISCNSCRSVPNMHPPMGIRH